MLRNQKGFTLMELMIVIVIIGVLAAIGVPAYTNYVEKARATTCDANRRSLSTANGLYYAENGEYAGDINDLEAYLDATTISNFTCPSKGTFTFNADNGTITCSKHDAQEP